VSYLRSVFVSKEVVGLGEGGDVSREFDKVTERIILSTLRDYLGDVRMVSEEVGVVGYGSWLAVVDPVDGSVNFEAGIPIASVSIGLARNYESVRVRDIVAAVVAEVFRDAIYYFDRGGGFKVIGVSTGRRSPPADVVLGYFESLESYMPFLELTRLLGRRPRLRSLGSAALDIVYVALGSALGFVDTRAKLRNVDVAAALSIANSLGAKAYLCNGVDALELDLVKLSRVECLVVGYDEVTAGTLLEAVRDSRRGIEVTTDPRSRGTPLGPSPLL
jgi:myo-inositol-1(or 4)-monophosphatase